jgi:thiamine-monophosphate kinase
MTHNATYSDEPTRVDQIVRNFFSSQTGSVFGADGSVHATLLAGADAKDDCAVFEIDGPASLVVGSDYVRGPKFILYELGLLSNFDIGYYVVAANVSDIAAMGALPLGVLTVVRYPNDLNDEGFRSIVAGIHQACTDFGTLNVGGDIGGAERIIVSATALGMCERGKVLMRRGAAPGDLLCVTGPCGLLGAAVAYFPGKEKNGWALTPSVEAALLNGWKRPRARIPEGRILASKPLATACQDTSDGLKSTIQQLADASNVGFEVFEANVPIGEEVHLVANTINVDPLALSMSASADFQLAFTVRPNDMEACREEFVARGLDFYVIGRANDQPRAIELIQQDGSIRALPGVAWKHQKTDIGTLVRDDAENSRGTNKGG